MIRRYRGNLEKRDKGDQHAPYPDLIDCVIIEELEASDWCSLPEWDIFEIAKRQTTISFSNKKETLSDIKTEYAAMQRIEETLGVVCFPLSGKYNLDFGVYFHDPGHWSPEGPDNRFTYLRKDQPDLLAICEFKSFSRTLEACGDSVMVEILKYSHYKEMSAIHPSIPVLFIVRECATDSFYVWVFDDCEYPVTFGGRTSDKAFRDFNDVGPMMWVPVEKFVALDRLRDDFGGTICVDPDKMRRKKYKGGS